MKMTIVADRSGKIVGTCFEGEVGKEEPKLVGIIPFGEQSIYDLEVPERLASKEMLYKLHETHFVDIVGGPKLREYQKG